MRPNFHTPDSEYAPHSAVPNTTAFILTGGKSRRMGHDKALLTLPSGETLIEHAIAVCAAVSAEVRIVGPGERYASHAWAGELIEDFYPERGPLGGIHAALSTTSTDWNIILAVDLPRVTPDLLRWMLLEAQRSSAVVTVPEVEGTVHPLCGIYRKAFCDLAQRALEQNRNKITAAYDQSSLRVLTKDELTTAGFSEELLINVNTPDEFERFSGK